MKKVKSELSKEENKVFLKLYRGYRNYKVSLSDIQKVFQIFRRRQPPIPLFDSPLDPLHSDEGITSTN